MLVLEVEECRPREVKRRDGVSVTCAQSICDRGVPHCITMLFESCSFEDYAMCGVVK